MKFNMITDRHNYDNGYIGLVNLDIGELPETIECESYTLHRKSEFHISLVCAKRIAPLIYPDDEDRGREEIVAHFLRIVKDIPLTDFELLPELRFVEKDVRKTLVVMAKVPGIKELFDRLRTEYLGVDIPTQQTHITLYTLQPEAGIGLLSKEEVDKISRPVKAPEKLKTVLRHPINK